MQALLRTVAGALTCARFTSSRCGVRAHSPQPSVRVDRERVARLDLLVAYEVVSFGKKCLRRQSWDPERRLHRNGLRTSVPSPSVLHVDVAPDRDKVGVGVEFGADVLGIVI